MGRRRAVILGNRHARPVLGMLRAWGTLVLSLVLCAMGSAQARQLEAGPHNYRKMLLELQAGDTLNLRAGTYRYGLPLHGLSGSPERPIVIQGPSAGAPAIFMGRPARITISLVDSHHLVVRRLVLNGLRQRTQGIVAEGKGRGTSHITLEHLTIGGFDGDQSFNCISTKAPAWHWVIRLNHLYDCGTGLYLGNSDGHAPFVAGRIEGNLVERSRGYNLQIKHQQPRPTEIGLIGLPSSPTLTLIRHNIFSKARHGSTGARARPNVLLGHWPLQGPGQHDRYVVYGNVFYQNPHERLLQAEGHVEVHSNLFINSVGEAVSFQPHNDVPRTIRFHHNTVVARGTAVALLHPARNAQQQLALNLVYSERPVPSLNPRTNRVRSYRQAEQELHAPFAPLQQLDLSPRQALKVAQPPAVSSPFLRLDFNGHRGSVLQPGAYAHVGAYAEPLTPLARYAAICGPCRATDSATHSATNAPPAPPPRQGL